MVEVITRFKLETTQFDSKLRDAAKELRDVAKEAERGGKDFNNFSQKCVDAARSLGNVASGANNTKDRVKDLVGAYNDAAKAYNSLTRAQQQSDFGKALAQSIGQLKDRISEAKQELYGLNDAMGKSGGGGGGLLAGLGGKMEGALAVFGGNLMTKAAGMAASFAAELGQAVQQGIELARQGEGIRNAFERLGRGDILDGLREATHGTVTDLELMKAAVMFNDFKLPIDELGTMLAFAQQKAKDTGQSVDYMVDSIVTGLGRKSLMILDNLGLSANEIKEKMKDTGDMTKAVGQIIREQMAKSGDYIETAADRATKADVELKNAMEDLGRTFQPLADEANNTWNSIKVGALNLLNDAIKPLIDSLTTAGRLRKELANMNGGGNGQPSFVDSQISALAGSNYKNYRFNAALGNYDKQIAGIQNELASRQTGSNVRSNGQYVGIHSQVLQDRLKALQTMRAEYVKRAKNILNPLKISEDVEKGIASGSGGGGRTSRGGGRSSVTTPKVDEILPAGSVAALNKELSELRKKQDLATDTAGWLAQQRVIDGITAKIKILKGQMPDPSNVQSAANGASITGESTFTVPTELHFDTGYMDNLVKKGKEMEKAYSLAASAVSSIGDAFASIEDPSAKAAGMVMQAIASIALGFATASTNANTAGTGWGWLAWLAAGAAAMATTISTVHSLTGFENGGEIKGNSFSGDNIPIMANAGEVVLTRAQQGNLASQLEGAATNVHVTGEVQGTKLVLVINRALKVAGKGELVTWK